MKNLVATCWKIALNIAVPSWKVWYKLVLGAKRPLGNAFSCVILLYTKFADFTLRYFYTTTFARLKISLDRRRISGLALVYGYSCCFNDFSDDSQTWMFMLYAVKICSRMSYPLHTMPFTKRHLSGHCLFLQDCRPMRESNLSVFVYGSFQKGWIMNTNANQDSKVYIFDDDVTTKEVITTLMQNKSSEVTEVTEPFLSRDDGTGGD